MSLTVTVQKGHDFSSGNVTRAALNAGAVPTVAVTGSVGTSELAADSVTATELKDDSSTDSNRAVTTDHIRDGAITEAKLADDAVAISKIKALTKVGNVIIGGTSGNPEELDAAGSNKLLIGNGTTLLSLPVDSSNSDITFTQDGTDIVLSIAAGKVTVGMHSNTTSTNPGLLAYGSGGVAEQISTATAGQVPISQGASAAPAFKAHHKVVPISATIVEGSWMTGAHGITTATGTTNHPHLVAWYYECTVTEHGYAVGDRIYSWGKEYDPSSSRTHSHYVDGSNVGIYLNSEIGRPYVFHKTTGTGVTGAGEVTAANWKIVAVVSEY